LNGKLKEKNLLTDFKITRGTVTTIDAAMIGPHGVSNPLVPLNELITTGTVFIDAEFLFQHLISQPDLCPFFCGSSGPFPAEGSWTGRSLAHSARRSVANSPGTDSAAGS
jgi:hypothetical protein